LRHGKNTLSENLTFEINEPIIYRFSAAKPLGVALDEKRLFTFVLELSAGKICNYLVLKQDKRKKTICAKKIASGKPALHRINYHDSSITLARYSFQKVQLYNSFGIFQLRIFRLYS
jgi:hypothetical protein